MKYQYILYCNTINVANLGLFRIISQMVNKAFLHNKYYNFNLFIVYLILGKILYFLADATTATCKIVKNALV